MKKQVRWATAQKYIWDYEILEESINEWTGTATAVLKGEKYNGWLIEATIIKSGPFMTFKISGDVAYNPAE